MDIKTKLAYAEQHVRNIARHEEEDAALRIAALDRVVALCNEESAAIQERVAARIAELNPAEPQ